MVAGALAVFFDLSRIAALGAFFYLVMDMLVHWGVYRSLRNEIAARAWILIAALAANGVILVAFMMSKLRSDPAVVAYAVIGIAVVFTAEWLFLASKEPPQGNDPSPNGD